MILNIETPMSATFKQPGDYLDYTNSTGTDIAVNSIVVVGDQIGIATVNIKEGETGVLAMSGVHILPKVIGNAWEQGKNLLWDASAKKFDNNLAVQEEGDVIGCCVAWRTADAAATTGWVKLNVGIGTLQS